MGLREIGECLGIAAVITMLWLGLQLIEWGSAAGPTEPPEVDAVELPNPVDVRVQGPGARARRARTLAAELRLIRREDEIE